MIEKLGDMVEDRLDLWKKSNGDNRYPSKIVFYRDGVSEGQFAQVLKYEFPQIKSAIRKKYAAINQPEAGVVILSVQKRHHTRLHRRQRCPLLD